MEGDRSPRRRSLMAGILNPLKNSFRRVSNNQELDQDGDAADEGASAHPKTATWMMGMLRRAVDQPSGVTQRQAEQLLQDDTSCSSLLCDFSDRGLRDVYHLYVARTRRESAWVMLAIAALLALRTILLLLVPSYVQERLPDLILSVVVLVAVVAFALFYVCFKFKLKDLHLKILILVAWLSVAVQIVFGVIWTKTVVSVTDLLECSLLHLYVTLVLLPFPIYIRAVLGVIAVTSQLIPASVMASTSSNAIQFSPGMIGANILLYVAAGMVGIVTSHTLSQLLRQSFLQNRAALSVSHEVEEYSKEQGRLLLSILPKHVAEEMLRDMGTDVTSQFRKIYMNRHEDVSILFADIVGFTALSSKVTSAELVRILNDLFATFDKLSQKYHQLRIKILGDCYYSISGCPSPRRDHAVLCIHMGLAMVHAIRKVRERTESGVNMRVGVHTGAVLGGVLGQLRWQYDVFGKEVTLANKMESGGVPGRVHISEVTQACLGDEFELEPGDGGEREEAIKMAGIKTFFIKKVLKPYPQGTLDHVTGDHFCDNEPHSEYTSPTIDEARKVSAAKLQTALMEKEDNVNLSEKLHPVRLHFRDPDLEESFQSETQLHEHVWRYIAALCFIIWTCFFALLCLGALDTASLASCVTGGCFTLGLCLLRLLVQYRQRSQPDFCAAVLPLWQTRRGHLVWAATAVIILVVSLFSISLGCAEPGEAVSVNNSVSAYRGQAGPCAYPAYLVSDGALVLVAISSLLHIEYIVRTVLLALVALLYFLLPWVIRPFYFQQHNIIIQSPASEGSLKWELTMSVAFVCLSTAMICRHLDRLCRKLYLCHEELEAVNRQISSLRAKNESLICNILPEHVARDFMGTAKKDEELYSHEYESVGVMFASCPNFNDFYTEDTVNSNGMECIRFLNEVLSDYDDLLSNERYCTITKIKTVGSTYMAASGMTRDRPSSAAKELGEVGRWSHLADLVDFAHAMKDTLKKINQQSFNNFMLRIGVNHGPVLAGVIGARKPHYDIWGNTVNVSSRMESMGQLDKIQVTEQTMEILCQFDYRFEKRGVIKVKGKGEITTYFLLDATPREQSPIFLPNQAS